MVWSKQGNGKEFVSGTVASTVPSSTTIILVRDCYVDVFHHAWRKGLGREGRGGIIITDQPGIGVSSFSPVCCSHLG